MNPSAFAFRHKHFILLLAGVCCVIGVTLVRTMPVAILPDMNVPRVSIIVDNGAMPTDAMMVAITRPLEQAANTTPGVRGVRSITSRGSAEITIDFAWGTDAFSAQQLVENRINAVRQSLPSTANIQIERMTPALFPILGYSVESNTLSQAELHDLALYQIRPRLSRVPDVSQVVVQGGDIREFWVRIDPEKLQAVGLSLSDVGDALSKANEVNDVGRYVQAYKQYLVLATGRLHNAAEIAHVTVASRNGVPITVGDLAQVEIRNQEQLVRITANGHQAVLINVLRQPTGNTVKVAQGIKQELQAMKPSLPPDVHFKVFYDQSQLVAESIKSVRDAILIGGLLAAIILLIFLGNLRNAVVVLITIPVVLLISLALARLAGQTLNIMTLGAFAIALGLVIDDGIVVVENVYRHMEGGKPVRAAIFDGVREITPAMIASSLSSIVVFFPLIFLTGVPGEFFRPLSITIMLTLTASLAVSLLIVPLLSRKLLALRAGHASATEHEHAGLFGKIVHRYERLLRSALRHKRIVGLGCVCVLIAVWAVGRRLPTGFMPEMDEGAFVLDYWTPPGTSLDETNRVLMQVAQLLKKTPEVESWSRRTGTQLGFFITEQNTGDFAVKLKPNRNRSVEQITDSLRQQIEQTIPNLRVDFVQVLQDMIGDLAGTPEPIRVNVYGTDEKTLHGLAHRIGKLVASVPGVVDEFDGVTDLGPEAVVRIDPVRAARFGLTVDDVTNQLNAALLGTVATTVLQGEKEVNVRVRYDTPEPRDSNTLRQTRLTSSEGKPILLSQVADITTEQGTTEIDRQDQQLMVGVTARLSGTDLGTAVRAVQAKLASLTLPPGYYLEYGGLYKSQQQSFRNLLIVLLLAVLLVFTVLVLQYESFAEPVALFVAAALSLFGVVLGLWLTQTPFNISSFTGAIMIVGIVTENGIVLLDYIRELHSQSLPLEEVLIRAGRARLRPVMMTTVTAICTLFPLALGLGAGAQMQQPLAIAVIGGLALGMIFTLIVAPVVYASVRKH